MRRCSSAKSSFASSRVRPTSCEAKPATRRARRPISNVWVSPHSVLASSLIVHRTDQSPSKKEAWHDPCPSSPGFFHSRHGLRPHQIRQFKLSNDPQFAGKVRDIVGLYVGPPEHAVVLSVDEKSQIQALDRTQPALPFHALTCAEPLAVPPSLPLKKGRCGTMTHDYKRNGTTTLFAAFNVLEGSVIGRCMQRHTHQEFIRFLNVVENQVPANKQVHVVLDNYATHKRPKVIEWLGRHDRFTFHFTPTSAS